MQDHMDSPGGDLTCAGQSTDGHMNQAAGIGRHRSGCGDRSRGGLDDGTGRDCKSAPAALLAKTRIGNAVLGRSITAWRGPDLARLPSHVEFGSVAGA